MHIYSGPLNAELMIVGEAPGEREVERSQPFVGASGQELDRMLSEAGLSRSQFYITNCTSIRPPGNDIEEFYWGKKEAKERGEQPFFGRYPKPPLREGVEHLHKLVRAINPRLILAFGDTALWALTGQSGITKWRGSVLPCILPDVRTKIIPTFHPAAILRVWPWRYIAVQDMRRAARESDWDGILDPGWIFHVRPSFRLAMDILRELEAHPREIATDVETVGKQITTVGLSLSPKEAISIPFITWDEVGHSYWNEPEELAITLQLRKTLTTLRQIIFQNGAYDLQRFAFQWGYLPNISDDTMIMQHVALPGIGGGALKGKSLDFIASLYCEHYRYWKDDGKTFDPRLHNMEQHWSYNCEDCVRTHESKRVLDEIINSYGLRPQYEFQMHRLFPKVVRMMLRGVGVHHEFRDRIQVELSNRQDEVQDWITTALGHPLNPRSSLQMNKLFYEDFQCQKHFKKATGALTTDEEALTKLAKKYPLLQPLILKIAEFRSLGVFKSTFAEASLSNDQRLRCSINLTGTETFRFSTSEDAFGTGTNLQNIPKDKPSKKKITEEFMEKGLIQRMPNIRKMFRPDPGYTLFELDLQRADAQVVAWDSDDPVMKQIFKEQRDLWTESCKELYGRVTHTLRQTCKQAGHATNYGASARTIAEYIGVTVKEAEDFQRRWLGAFKGIARWHGRIQMDLYTGKIVRNAFGYRRFYFDRVDGLLPEALAWVPQSTVALTINHALCQLEENIPELQMLLQVHDSVVFQIPTPSVPLLLPKIRQHSLVTIPYPDPLIIPTSLAISTVSWGDVEELHHEEKAT